MICRLILAAALNIAPALQAKNNALVGAWDKDGAPFAELRADGSGEVEGKPVTWTSLGRMLFLTHPGGETESIAFTLKGDSLQVSVDGDLTALTRRKKGAKAKVKTPPKSPAKAGSGKLAELLLSSPWCSFSYNKTTGASREERFVFRRNGTWSSGKRAESYSSGAFGTVAGQSGGSGGGRWEVRGERLLIAEEGAGLEDAGLSVTKNSNGYPILKADGKEYSQCR